MDSINKTLSQRIAVVLGHIAAGNTFRPQIITPFHCDDPAPISLVEYLDRMSTFMGCSQECFVIGCVLITRLEAVLNNQSLITPLSVHRLILTSMVLAVKMHEDQCFSNQHYADVGGIPVTELNELELHMAKQLKWHLQVSRSEFRTCENVMQSLYDSIPVFSSTSFVDAEENSPETPHPGPFPRNDVCVRFPCVMTL
eukprot:c20550_g1_i1.p1 GENE.c20550_g1_i1~~c20550_g1_i1.p1  ORF type:complete len:198 (+),score=23.76 c20550_g1_i1:293-886(+)